MNTTTEQLKEMEKVADELAEKDSAEFAKAPYSFIVRETNSDGKGITRRRIPTRIEFKKKVKDNYILIMMEIKSIEMESKKGK